MTSSLPKQQLRIAAVTRKPQSASYIQRIERYIPLLAQQDIHVTEITLPKGFWAQRRLLNTLNQYDGVWWHRHQLTFPHLSCLRKNSRVLVFDFDDPVIFSSENGGKVSITRRFRFGHLLRQCNAALTASGYLHSLAHHYCQQTTILPMAIDLPENVTTARSDTGPIQLLWLGSRSTQTYLEQLRPTLEQLGELELPIQLRLVAHEQMTFGRLDIDFRQWSILEQDNALRQCHIGLCPMPDTMWTRGKCPFKVIQYMAHGMPWVGSAVGENILCAGDPNGDPTGLCATTPTQWCDAIVKLALDMPKRQAMGHLGIDFVKSHHDRNFLAKQLGDFWRQICTTPMH